MVRPIGVNGLLRFAFVFPPIACPLPPFTAAQLGSATDSRIFRLENQQSSEICQELLLYNATMPEFLEEPDQRQRLRFWPIIDSLPK